VDLRVNRNSHLPIHIQLKAQLTHLIQAGQLAPGAQLPTVRQLAGFLRINRNTAAKVFAELEREGYLSCEPGRGTFVAPPRARAESGSQKIWDLLAAVDEAIAKAKQLGFSTTEFSAALYARAQTALTPARVRKVPVLFVECNQPQLKQFSSELEQALPVRVDPLLVKDLKRMVRETPGSLGRYAVVVTTFFHHHEVQSLLAKTGMEVVGLLAEATLKTLMRLTALSEGTKVGVACNGWTGTENAKLSIQNAGLTHLRLVPGCGKDEESLRRMLKEASVVVCTSLVEGKIRTMAPPATEIIVDDRRLDRAGMEMLRRHLAELQARDNTPPQPQSQRPRNLSVGTRRR
jgi:DNA-binding transcriptional regulator YhcF (GntR family)